MTELDLQDLADRATLAAQAWQPGCAVTGVRIMEGGTVGLVYSATAGDTEIVLKVAPPGLAPVRNRDVLRQARCIAALDGMPGVGVPELLFTDEGVPPDVPPLFATRRVEGECVEPLLEAARTPVPVGIARARGFAAARMLAALHTLVPGDIGLGDEPETTCIGEVDRWTRTLDTVPSEVRTGYLECADALRATAPDAVPAVVVHGDYRLGNMLSEGTEVRAIVDWEIWSLSDPRIDLSWFLFFTDEARHPVADHGIPSGMPTDIELLDCYAEAAGAMPAELDWFHALTRYKEAAAMALIAKHAARRDPASPMLERMAVMLPAMIADAKAQRLLEIPDRGVEVGLHRGNRLVVTGRPRQQIVERACGDVHLQHHVVERAAGIDQLARAELGGPQIGSGLVVLQDLPGDGDLVDLGGPVHDPHQAAHVAAEAHEVRRAERAVQVLALVGDRAQDLGRQHLARGDVAARLGRAGLVDQPRGV